MLIPCFCLSLDFLWVPLAPSFSVGHRFLRRGREADGVCVWAASFHAIRPGDTDPTRTDVPRDPPHVVHSTASDGWGGGCCSGNWGFYWKHTFRVLQRQWESRSSVCLNIVSAWSIQTSWLIYFYAKKQMWLDLFMEGLIVPTEPCSTTSMLTF